jgi:hypothetical protein
MYLTCRQQQNRCNEEGSHSVSSHWKGRGSGPSRPQLHHGFVRSRVTDSESE